MKASKNRKAVIVGLFTLIGLVILIVGILTLGARHKSFGSMITIKASFPNVNGLTDGNDVWYRGVLIGNVKDISLAEDSSVVVLLEIDKDACRHLHRDVTAKIASEGLFGNRLVVLEGGSNRQPLLQDGDSIAPERIIGTQDLVATLQKNNDNLLAITTDLKTISRRIVEGEGTVGTLLRDKTLVTRMQTVVATLQQASDNTRQATSDLARYSSRLQTQGSFSNDLVSDTLLFYKLRASAAQIQDASQIINAVAGNIQTASYGLNDTNKPIGVLLHNEQVADTLRLLIQNLHSSSIKLNEDLEAIQHNFLFRGYFRKKRQAAN